MGGGSIDPKGGGGETVSSPTSLDCSHLETVPGKSPLTAALGTQGRDRGSTQGTWVSTIPRLGGPRGAGQQEACPSPK